jgi:hypothetical protein
MGRAGVQTLHLVGKAIVDDGNSSRAPPSITSGWFFLRILVELDALQIADFADNHGIVFTTVGFIQPGWFKLYFNEKQVDYLRTKSNLVALLSVKQHIAPDFEDLRNETSFSVQAVDDWNPDPPIKAQRFGRELFIVSGGTAEEIWSDPKVASISKEPNFSISLP